MAINPDELQERTPDLDADAPDPLIAGRYRVQQKLAKGGLGAVYVARDERTGLFVVIKTQQSSSPRWTEVFEREARLLSRFNSSHVVRFVDFLSEGGKTYLVQEHVEDAVSLDVWQSGRALSELLVAYATIAGTLATLHAEQVVHRDLKPGNVLMRKDEPVLIDFGLAVHAGEADQLTSTDTVVGTPAYMAPEAIGSDARLGPAADVFALGVMLFEALTKSLPEGDVSSVRALLSERTAGGQHWAGLQRIAGIPALSELRELLSKMLETRPNHRPSGARIAELLGAMARDSRLGGLVAPLTGEEGPAGQRAAPAGAPAAPRAAPFASRAPHALERPAPPRRASASLRWLALGAGLLLGMIAVLLVVALGPLGAFDPASTLRTLPIIGWSLVIATAAVAGALLTRQLWLPRPAPGVDLGVSQQAVRRIAAIEAHLERTNEFTQSLAIHLEELVQEQVANAVRESLVVALRELKPVAPSPATDTERLIALVEKLATPRSERQKPQPKPWSERLQGYFGIPIAFVAATTGMLGLAGTLGLWGSHEERSQTPYSKLELRLPRDAVAGRPVEVSVVGLDEQRDALSFAWFANGGTLEPNVGPTVRWTLLGPAPGTIRCIVMHEQTKVHELDAELHVRSKEAQAGADRPE